MKANHIAAKRVVDVMLALGVSLRSSDYLTQEDLKSFRLAPVDDEDDVGLSLVVSSSSTVVPLRL